MRYSFKQQFVSGLAAAFVFAAGLAILVALFGGVNLAAALTANAGQAVHGLVSFIVLALLVFIGAQQAMLRLVIYRK